MPRPKESDRDQIRSSTRRRLLDSAAILIARDGYDGANINDISTAAGFAKGTIYNYFPSKRELMLALIEDIAAGHIAGMAAAVRGASDPGERLRRFFEAGFAFVTNNPARSQVMIHALYGYDNELKMLMYEAYLPLFQLLAREVLLPGMESGLFRKVDPMETAGLLMTLYLGASSQVNEEGRPWLDPQTVAAFALHALAEGG